MAARTMKRLLQKWLKRRQPPSAPSDQSGRGWIGVDLDGTVAHYDEWLGPHHIGDPIEPMVARIRAWQASGVEVRIFTARASDYRHRRFVELWLERHELCGLKVTNQKDYGMIELWDDRCVQIRTNSGEPVSSFFHQQEQTSS